MKILFRFYEKTYTGTYTGEVIDLEYINEETIESGRYDGTIHIWSLSIGITNRTISTSLLIWSLKMMYNAWIYLAACLIKSNIIIYDINTGSPIWTLTGHIGNVYDLVFLDSNLMATSGQDHTIHIWNLTSNTTQFTLTGHSRVVSGLKLLSTDVLASGSEDFTVKLWNITSGELIRTLSNHSSYISWGIDLLNGETLESGSHDQTIKLWNWTTGEMLRTISTSIIRIIWILG